MTTDDDIRGPRPPHGPQTRSRTTARYVLSVAVLGLLVFASRVGSSVGVLTSGADQPVEARVALAVGPDRSTLWAQLVIEADGGPVAMIVPAEAGASLDWSAPAWFEALEMTTAPRILPPLDPGPECAGFTFFTELTGDSSHFVPVSAQALDVLPDADGVVDWALGHGLDVPGDLPDRLAAVSPTQFVAVAFQPQAGRVFTPVLRIVSSAPAPWLPLVLTKAGSDEVLVTAWLIGEGGARIAGAPTATLEAELLAFNRAGVSNYPGLRLDALSAFGAGSALTESASHESLTDGTPAGPDTVPSLVDTYIERSVQQGTGSGNAASCLAATKAALGQGLPVAPSCPRADLGVVAGVDDCVESPTAGEIDPAELRCGDGADDLAVALSGLNPESTWLTRISQRIGPDDSGTLAQVSFGGTTVIHPVLQAARGNCRPDRVPVYSVDSGGCGDPELGPVLYWVEVEVILEEEDPPDAYYVEEEDCGGDPSDPQENDGYDEQFGVQDGEATETGGSDCSGSSDSTAGDSSEDCGGSTESSTATGGGGTGGSDTGGETSSDSSGSDCGSDSSSSSSDSGCGKSESSSSSDSSCSVARKKRVRRPRFSLLFFCLVALLAPLRRWGGRRRRARHRWR